MKHLITLASVVMLLSVSPVSAATSDVEKNKQVARQWFEEVIVKEDTKKLDQLCDKNVTANFAPGYAHNVSGNNKISGIEPLRKHLEALAKKTDYSGKIIELFGEGDKVVLYRDTTAKTEDGHTASVPWMTIFHFKNGKIVSMVHLHDTLAEHEQLSGHKK
jgi:ketosteroid isomerase-like protein